jgi:hypothetical protein
MRLPSEYAEPVDPTRVRPLPRHFAWVDHRLRDRLRALRLEDIALLLFLHLAADRHGLSFWSDATIARKLSLSEGEIVQARGRLVAGGFVLYRAPLYQLLALSDDRP